MRDAGTEANVFIGEDIGEWDEKECWEEDGKGVVDGERR